MLFTLENFYQSKAWIKLVAQLRIDRVNEEGKLLCEYCHKPIITKYDCIGHHKKALTEKNINDYDISLNEKNIMLVHHRCHNKIHERFCGKKTKEVFLVYGAPCSGKSTYVNKHAGRNDIILDIDKIYECISNNDKYIKPNSIKNNVFYIRDCILDMIKVRYGYWEKAFIIGGYPLKMDRERLVKELGCKPIFIDEEKEICLQRVKDRPKEWEKYIEDYFEKFQP